MRIITVTLLHFEAPTFGSHLSAHATTTVERGRLAYKVEPTGSKQSVSTNRGSVVLRVLKHELGGIPATREPSSIQERFGAWLHGTGEVVFLMSPDWSRMYELHGKGLLANTESVDDQWSDKYLHPDELPRIRAAIRSAIQTKGVFSLEHRVLRADGTWGWAFTRAVPILDKNGNILEWFGMATDMSNRAETQTQSELKWCEEASKLSSLLGSMVDEVWFADTDGNIKLANTRSVSNLGFWGAQQATVPAYDLASELDILGADGAPRPLEQAPLLRALKGEVIIGEIEAIRNLKTMEYRWREFNASPVRDIDGRIIGAVTVVRDTTDRKRAEEAVVYERQWLRTLLDSMSDEVWFTDASGSVKAANTRALKGLGFSDSNETDKKVLDLSTESDVLRVDGTPKPSEDMPPLRVLKGEPFVCDVELVRHKRTGEVRYRDIVCSPVRDSVGQTVGAVSVIRDTTESRKREHELEELRQEALQRAAEWNALIHASPDAIYLTDEKGAVLEANSALHTLLGFEQGTPIPNILDLPQVIVTMPDGSPIDIGDRPTARVLRGEEVVNSQYRIVNVKGQQSYSLHNTTVIDTPRGKRSLSIVSDITELKRLERLKDEFMLVVGHELRNPLQVILGRLQLLEMKLDQDSLKEFSGDLESLKTQARLLVSIVEDLLNAYRIGHGRLSVEMVRTDLREVLLSTLEPYVLDPNHHWSFSLPKTRFEVMADPLRLRQAITNLLTNAQKYTPTGKAIHIRLGRRKGWVILKVEDEGVGIPPDDLERVFDGFYRTPDVTKWQPGSVGLGLFISRSLVKRMGGHLWAENRPGNGTVMCLKMPLLEKQESPPSSGM